MARFITVTKEHLDDIRKEFDKLLSESKFADGKISFSKVIGSVDRKATVYFTEMAWLKTKTLVDSFSKEVGWHGVAYRGTKNDKDSYYISDILVYPQEVTGSNVTTDQVEFQTWLMSQEDEVFNNIRMQGHSHVNMGVSPSPVDTTLYEGILEQLEDDMFYIFMIFNKKGDMMVKIYDMGKNIFFDTNDVDVKVLDDGSGIEAWLNNAKSIVKEKTYTITPKPVVSKEDTKYSEDIKTKKKKKEDAADNICGYGGNFYNGYFGNSYYDYYDNDYMKDPFYAEGV